MAKFIVTIQEVWTQLVEVEASSEEEAIDKVVDGEGYYIDNALEYSHTLDRAFWTVEEE